jgi:hypothetical protein
MRIFMIACIGFLMTTLEGCGTTAPTSKFVTSDTKTWKLEDAPNLAEVITVPVTNIAEVARKVSTQTFMATHKDKFESDEAFKARAEKATQGYGTAFLVKSLSTYDCTKYDFQKNVFNINCKAFRKDDELEKEIKPTGKKTQLANAYTSREVEFFESKTYRVSVATDAVAQLNISSDDAKRIDRDLMVGVLISIKSADYEMGGCSEVDVTYDSKVCKPTAFQTGAAFSTKDYMIIPKEILETVIYLKSSNKVLSHKKYTLQK